jgi:antitoxin HicB
MVRKTPTKKNPHIGSSFESWLDEEGIREEAIAAAKFVIARQLANKMKKRKSPISARPG